MSEEFNNFNTPSTNEPQNKGMAIASMVCGIVSIVLVCCSYYISIPCAIVGLVLGIMSNKKFGKNGMATAGIVCSIVTIALSVIVIILGAILGAAITSAGLSEIMNGLNY